MGRSNGFGAAADELRESRLVWVVWSACDAIAAAARHSRALAAGGRIVRGYLSAPPAVRLRLAALTIAVAIVTHVLLGQFVPPHLAPMWLLSRIPNP